MRNLRSFTFLLFTPVWLLLFAAVAPAQTPASEATAVFTVEPSCPVTATGKEADNTKELHITYRPGNAAAAIKNPQQLTVEIAINSPNWRETTRAVPLMQQASGEWMATLPHTLDDIWWYLIFMVKDEKTGQVDNNQGRYWDLVTCLPGGVKHSSGVELQAASYTGVQFKNGITRVADYKQATALLDEYLKGSDPNRFNALYRYWDYKLQGAGKTPEAWAQLSGEINDFLEQHKTDAHALQQAGNFIVYSDRLSASLKPKCLAYLRAVDPKRADDFAEMIEFHEARKEKDPATQLEKIRQFLGRHPNSFQKDLAIFEEFSLARQLGDVATAEQAFKARQQLDPDWPDTYAAMALVYIENSVKIDEALGLLAKTEDLLKSGKPKNARGLQTWLVVSPDAKKSEAILDYLRARAYLAQGKAALALPLAEKALATQKNSNQHFVAGEAYEGTGAKEKAIDAYLQAVVRPSENHMQQMERLQKLWTSGKFGSAEELEHRLGVLRRQQFEDAHYTPSIVDEPAPEFAFTSLSGEKFTAADLRNKAVVLNFWATWCAPCIPELSGLEELQKRHPEMLVVALALESTVDGVQKVIQKQGIAELKIGMVSEAERPLAEKGVPKTYLIENGRIRTVHGAIPDPTAYIEADLAALGKTAAAK